MSTSVLPSLPGLTWPLPKTSIFSTRKQDSVSGKQTRISDWSYPKYQWEIEYSVLRQGTFTGVSYTEQSQLEGFFDSLRGGFDSFLYQDASDNAVTGQSLGTGDGTTVAFQIVRAYGGFVMPVLAPNVGGTINVYVNNVLQSGASYTITPWGTANANGPGYVVFNAAPGSGLSVKIDLGYYFPCSFDNDKMTFSNFMNALYSSKKISFTSIK